MIKWIPFTILIFIIAITADRLSRTHQKFGQRLTIWTAAVYFAAVSWLTMTPTSLDIPTASKHFFYFHTIAYNIIPFQGTSVEFFLNILMTVPAGIYLYLWGQRSHRLWKVLLVGVGLGLLIESCQFVCDLVFDLQRTADIDDVITNAFGVYLGFIGMGVLGMTPLRLLFNKLTIFDHQ